MKKFPVVQTLKNYVNNSVLNDKILTFYFLIFFLKIARSLKAKEKFEKILDSVSGLLVQEFQDNRLLKTISLQVEGSESDRSERDNNGRIKLNRTLSQVEKTVPRSNSLLQVHGNAFSLSSTGESPKLARVARMMQTPEQNKKSSKKEDNLTNVNSSTECERPTSLLKRKLTFEHYECSLPKIVENQNGSIHITNESFVQERRNTSPNCRGVSLSESSDLLRKRSMFRELKDIPKLMNKNHENTCIRCNIF
jgi:hypothetical protein